MRTAAALEKSERRGSERRAWVPRASDLEHAPLLLTLDEVAAIYRQSVSTLRKRLAEGTMRPAPFMRAPYRWRRVDIESDLTSGPTTPTAADVTPRKRRRRRPH